MWNEGTSIVDIMYKKSAVKSLKAMDKPTRERIVAGINKLPVGDIKKLKGYSTLFRLRIGDFRVLFELNKDIIVIVDVLPRGEAYKNI